MKKKQNLIIDNAFKRDRSSTRMKRKINCSEGKQPKFMDKTKTSRDTTLQKWPLPILVM